MLYEAKVYKRNGNLVTTCIGTLGSCKSYFSDHMYRGYISNSEGKVIINYSDERRCYL